MLTIKDGKFQLYDKDYFLLSGEMHYFRIKKQDWKRHIQNMKKAHLNTVSTYIPWSWHEIKKGEFDLTGQTIPERDIIGFLDLIKSEGLHCTVKPGPYILAEYLNQGIPEWLIQKYPEVQVQDPWGNYNMPFVCSFMNQTYIDFSLKWYDMIMPVIRERQISNGGPIYLMQVCNEVGVQQWLGGIGDYSKTTIHYYHTYLEEKYKTIAQLNKLYKTTYKNFKTVRPPHMHTKTKTDFIRYHDWHQFHRWYYWYYVKFLIKEIRKRDISIQFFHNVPGWVYGKAEEFPVNLSVYSELSKLSPELILGVDHIPENVTFRNFHDDLVINEMTKAVQNYKAPAWAAEFQAGSREHCVKTYPREMTLFYKASLAHGLVGWNYYMFSQGINPPRKGVYGPTFYWYTPLDAKGNTTDAYESIERLGNWLQNNSTPLINTTIEAELGIALYKPYYQTEFFYPLFEKMKYIDLNKVGIQYDPKQLRDMYYFEGLLRIVQMLNIHFQTPDLEIASVTDLLRYKQLWCMSMEYMDSRTQQKLVSYVKKGGNLVIYPVLPKVDLDLKKCRVMRDELAISEVSSLFPIDNKIEFDSVEAIASYGFVHTYDEKSGKLFGKLSNGKYCCVEKKVGKGSISVLGTAFSYQIEEHIALFKSILTKDKIRADVSVSNDDIVAILRKNEDCDYLFLLNYHPEDIPCHVSFENLRIPQKGDMTIPRTFGMILPINKKVSDDAEIVYATSEINNCQVKENKITLSISNSRKVNGELILKTKKNVNAITLNKKKVSVEKIKNNFFKITYSHSGTNTDDIIVITV
ncbi:beta-galactosidase [Chlamydiota bacterium]